MKKSGSIVTIGLLLGALCCALPAAAGNRSTKMAYEFSRLEAERCRENLGRLYRCLEAYAKTHQGMLPPGNNFEGLRLLGEYGADYRMFHCSGSRVKTAKSNAAMSESVNPFLYFGGLHLERAKAASPNIPLLMDKPGARHFNIVYVDGRMESVEAGQLGRKISNCREIVERLHRRYGYSAEVLEMLRLKAGAIDSK